MQAYDISLDMKKAPGRIERTVVVRRGDNDTQQIRASVTAGGQPYTPKGTARLDIMHADGTWARCSASVSGSTATCTLPSAALNGAGRCRAAHFVFTDGAKVESTEGFALVIQPDIDSNGSEQAKDYDDELSKLNQKWSKLNAEAEKAERGRVAKEAERVSAEEERKSKETERASAESDRKAAESERKKAEEARKAAETARAQAEQARADAEKARKAAEDARVAAEQARAEAEKARETAQAKNNADQAQNNASAQGLQVVKLAEGQYDKATGKPTVDGAVGKLYFVPASAVKPATLAAMGVQTGGDAYIEWMWLDGKWEHIGMSNATITPLTTAEIDRIAAGEGVTSEGVVNGSMLTYLWAKFKAGFAVLAHRHKQSDIDGLADALAGKAASTHRHTKAQVDGLESDLSGIRDSLSHTVGSELPGFTLSESGDESRMSVTLTTPMLKTGSVYTIYVNEEGIGCWDTTKKMPVGRTKWTGK